MQKTVIFRGFIFMTLLMMMCPMIAQTSKDKGVVEYGVELIYNPIDRLQKDFPPETKKSMRQDFESVKPALPRLNYTLRFNKNESSFSSPEFMRSDNKKINLDKAASLSHSKGVFYTNTKENFNLHTKDLGDKTFLVKTEGYDWKLTDETKVIAGYPCKKATTKVKLNSVYTAAVTAWYCPSITYNFGPKGYYGLPGLILGIEEHGFYFYAKEVNLDKAKVNVKKPKGKIISKKNYYKTADDYYSNSW